CDAIAVACSDGSQTQAFQGQALHKVFPSVTFFTDEVFLWYEDVFESNFICVRGATSQHGKRIDGDALALSANQECTEALVALGVRVSFRYNDDVVCDMRT